MNNITAIIIAISIGSSSAVIASPVCNKNFGILECGSGTVPTISFTGLVEMNGTTVSESFDVLGDVDIQSADITNMHLKGMGKIKNTVISGYINVTGEINLNKIKIAGPATITGNFLSKNVELTSTAKMIGITKCDSCAFHSSADFVGELTIKNSQFDSNISIEAKEAEFTNTRLQNIYIKKSPQHDEETVVLAKNSSVKNITFEDGNGRVIVSTGSHITGRVDGGKVVNN